MQKLYEFAEGNPRAVIDIRQLESQLKFTKEEANQAAAYLHSKGLISYKCRVMCVRITVMGIDEVEAMMKSEYAEKERCVLMKIYEMGGVSHTDWVDIQGLVEELGMSYHEVNDILIDLEKRKGLIDGIGEAVKLIAPGIEFIEAGGQQQSVGTTITYNANIHTNYGGLQMGTHGSTQYITLTNTNNPDFDHALASLVELIRSSQMSDDDKEEIAEEITKINKLALREPAPGMLDRVKNRLDMIKLAVTGTDIGIKAAPHLNMIWEILKQRFGG